MVHAKIRQAFTLTATCSSEKWNEFVEADLNWRMEIGEWRMEMEGRGRRRKSLVYLQVMNAFGGNRAIVESEGVEWWGANGVEWSGVEYE